MTGSQPGFEKGGGRRENNEATQDHKGWGTSSHALLGLVSSPDQSPEKWKGEGLGTLAKFWGCADVAFLIPGLSIR
jgi:hypothetical protein